MDPDTECKAETFDDAVEIALDVNRSLAHAGYGDENCCSIYDLDDLPILAEIARVEVHGVTSNVALSVKYPQGWTDFSVEE
jgi:hypothetical protein